jgi:hypothetical protein
MLRFQMMTGALSGSRYRPASHHQFGGGLKQLLLVASNSAGRQRFGFG